MAILESLRADVEQIALERKLDAYRAFGYYYLENIEDLSQEDAANSLTDGPWDHGRDAVVFDEETGLLSIYQFKYSENEQYVIKAYTDIQKGIIYEHSERGSDIKGLRCVVVSLTVESDILRKQEEAAREACVSYLEKHGLDPSVLTIEHVNLISFTQLQDRLVGVRIKLKFKDNPITDGGLALGLLDLSSFVPHVADDRLLAFNIRRFLGKRKGSINWQIEQTLIDPQKNKRFAQYNNGIVCLYTSYDSATDTYENLTVVNGAQTVTTVCKYLEQNPAWSSPIWAVAKIIKVEDTDIETASELTKTSNSQNPAQNRDLKATDVSQRYLEEWVRRLYDMKYIYKRGVKPQQGQQSITMKDLAQAFIATTFEQPHVSFARPGQIFLSEVLYPEVFPDRTIQRIKANGDENELASFIADRVVPTLMLLNIRDWLRENAAPGKALDDIAYRSLSYHILFLYHTVLTKRLGMRYIDINRSWSQLLEESVDDIAKELQMFVSYGEHAVPKALKTERFTSILSNQDNLLKKATAAISNALERMDIGESQDDDLGLFD